MAEEDSDLERTEEASQRRIEQAREKGQIARSRELTTFAVLMVAAAIVQALWGTAAERKPLESVTRPLTWSD